MATDMPVALAKERADVETESTSGAGEWAAAALTAAFAAAAVLFVSFIAVVTGLV
jgi:hypothetical protein